MQSRSEASVIGHAVYEGRLRPVGILPRDRHHHMLVIGKSGTGKTTLLSNLIVSDMQAGRGVGVVDPHGELVDSLLGVVPAHRVNDVLLVDVAGPDCGFNPLAFVRSSQHAVATRGFIEAFMKVWPGRWSPDLESVLSNTIRVLLENPEATLLALPRIIAEPEFRRELLCKVTNRLVHSYWENEFHRMLPVQRRALTFSTTNALREMLCSPRLRNLLGRPGRNIDVRRVMDTSQLLLVNLSGGRLGLINSTFLGALFALNLELIAMSRADQSAESPRDFFLYLDEFQCCATEMFTALLPQAGKCRLSVTIAHQYLGQLGEHVNAAVFRSVENIIVFQVGGHDARLLATHMGRKVQPRDLESLRHCQAYIRWLTDGEPNSPVLVEMRCPNNHG